MESLFGELGGVSLASGLLRDLESVHRTLEILVVSNPESEANTLIERVRDLKRILRAFHRLENEECRNPWVQQNMESSSAGGLLHLQAAAGSAVAIIKECDPLIPTLKTIVEEIVRQRDDTGYAPEDTRFENQAWYGEMHEALRLTVELLEALHTTINLLYGPDVSEEGELCLKKRSSTSTQLHFQINLVEQRLALLDKSYHTVAVKNAIQAAKAVTVYIPPVPNKHFFIARPVRACFTGREMHLTRLEAAFHDATMPMQQRFVIFGLSGSGKTELAFKFADSFRHKFWGVFYVDGSSRKNARSSNPDIATLGGVEPNEKAAKNWLMTRDLPWLLIIDNIDDGATNVDELLPTGAKGCVLITTRNPAVKAYGNFGYRYMELLPMEPEEANVLLIKAAEEPRPRSKSTEGRGTLADGDGGSINVFSSYEILYESLAASPQEKYRDAIELLHVFSYFHFQNIRLDTLISAAVNPMEEKVQQEEEADVEQQLLQGLGGLPRKSWVMLFRELRAAMMTKLATPVPLPGVLRNPDGLGRDDHEDEVTIRLRQALGVLIERSLVTRQERATKRYSMHRLVHKWVRDRLEFSTSHQSLWCQVSMATLAMSIHRPPHGNTEAQRIARRELLPHMRHVLECHLVLQARLDENAAGQHRPWQLSPLIYRRLQADQDVRFSRVFAETGNFEDAKKLLERASQFVSGRLGPDHPLGIRLSLLLSQTLWDMSEMGSATQRLRRSHELCVSSWGERHPLTLDVTDMLASALYMKGRWAEATSLHTANLEKLTALYGERHEKTLKSMRNLGRLHYRYMDYEKATALHQISWDGMRETLGHTHLETLISLEDLSMSYVQLEDDAGKRLSSDDRLVQSHRDMTWVYNERRQQLGAEHPYTLLAVLYLGRLKSHLGQSMEAEIMIREGIKVAERNFGEKHVAILLAKTIYGEVLAKLGRLEDAETQFHRLTDKTLYSRLVDDDGDHPDRLTNLWLLSECLEKRGKLQEALAVSKELLQGLGTIGGNGLGMRHKILPRTIGKISRLEDSIAMLGRKLEVE